MMSSRSLSPKLFVLLFAFAFANAALEDDEIEIGQKNEVEEPDLLQRPVNLTQKRGQKLVIPCTGVKDLEEIDVFRWFRDEDLIFTWFENDSLVITEPNNKTERISLDNNDMSFVIVNSHLEDSGTYRCDGWTTFENGSTGVLFNSTANVLVNDAPGPPSGKPKVFAISSHSILVRWNATMIENNSPITGYNILIYTHSDGKDTFTGNVTIKGNRTTNMSTLKFLYPYTQYTVRICALNAVGQSITSDPSEPVYTLEAYPSGKPRIQGYANHTSWIHIEFKPPPSYLFNGILKGYVFMYRTADSEVMLARTIVNATITGFNFTDLQPFTLYVFQIKVFNSVGEGPAVNTAIWTDEGVPTKPRITNIPNRTEHHLQVVWERPQRINGNLRGYTIFWTLHNITRDHSLHTNSGNDMMTYNLLDLYPYTAYNLQVAAFTRQGRGDKSNVYPGLTDVKGPSAPTYVNLTLNSSMTLKVEWSIPEIYYKQIDLYKIRYSSKQLGVAREMKVTSSSFRRDTQDIEASADRYSVLITNLIPNTIYEVQVAGSTRSIFYPDKYFTGDFSSRKPIYINDEGVSPTSPPMSQPLTAGIIAGLACTAIFLLLMIAIFILVRSYFSRRYHNVPTRDTQNHVNNSIALPENTYANKRLIKNDTVYDPIDVDKWDQHVTKLHMDGDLGFSQEYEDINKNTRTDVTVNHSSDLDNKHKNRYINIMAYDHTRVILKLLQGKQKKDYINANFIDGYHKPRAYIAAQGPLPSTFGDFWQMVWEQNAAVICMITNLVERGRRKCDQYWPNAGEAQFGLMVVKIINTYKMAHYTVRVFTLKNLKVKKKAVSERVVLQYHYTDWPDHGVPDYTLPVLTYVRKAVLASPEDAGPLIIHCSAGVGRTGTFICLDSMIRQILDKTTVNVYGFLSHIRNQRNYLVQTEDQYIFIHDALLEYIQSNGETEIKDTQVIKHLSELQAEDDEKATLLERQFQLITSFQPKDFHVSSANLVVNVEKNRSKEILPIENARVHNVMQPGIEGSDYINASYLQGYSKNEEYIVTQHPLKSTVADFWRMVWDQTSMTIVLLSPIDEEDFIQFWPSKEEPMDFGHFKVLFEGENHQLNYGTKDFLLQSTQDDYEYTARLISTNYWPECCTPIITAFDLPKIVKEWDAANQEVEGPIIVIDQFGDKKAATFCALSTLREQLQMEGTVDVYMVAKLYHLKRAGVFKSQEDYHFLFKAVASLCENLRSIGDRDSGIGNCTVYNTLPNGKHLSRTLSRSVSRQETTM